MTNDDSQHPPISHGPQLAPVGEKSLPAKCKPNTLAYCPSMDLIAVATEDEELRVFRLNGQRVFGGSFGGDPYLDDVKNGEIRRLAWRGNGHLLAVACADGTIRIINSYSGKTVHHYHVCQKQEDEADMTDESQSAKITCLGWGTNFTDSKAALRHLQDAAGQLTVEDLLSTTVPSKAAALLKADLPRELALLDAESSLPKLSTLPGTGGDDDVFSTRASLDAIFHSNSKNTNDSVDVLLVGFDDGTVHLRIFDCFEIGSFQVGDSVGNSSSCQLLRHASHPLNSTHALLASVPAPDGASSALHLITIDLRFITKSERYLSLLASKTTQLQNLLRYINQTQKQIELEWKNAQDLPARYMRSINEDLQQKSHCDFVTAIYHQVVTGDSFDPMREFFVEIVGERGHKRWEKAVSSGYENVRRLTHECLLPALERCEVLLSRLIGLSKFHKLSDVLGLETPDLKAIVETLDCLHLLAHLIIIHVNEELTQFMAFSKWLRHEIDMMTAEPMSQTLEELMEKTDFIDHPQTLKYVRGALTQSRLRDFIQQLPSMVFRKPPPSAGDDRWAPTGHDRSFYDIFKKLLEQRNQSLTDGGDPVPAEHPKLNDLTRRLGLQFEKVFGQIALTQRRGILHRSALVLHPDCDGEVIDVTMCYETTSCGKVFVVYIASRSIKAKHLLYITRVVLDSANGVSSTKWAEVAAIDFREGEIRQIQFVGDGTIMLLWSCDHGSYLLNFGFSPFGDREILTEYTFDNMAKNGSSPEIPTTVDLLSPSAERTDIIKHAFAPSGPKSKPMTIEVNGREGRRAVCVVYSDGMRYEVLDIDAEVEDEEEEDEGEENETSLNL